MHTRDALPALVPAATVRFAPGVSVRVAVAAQLPDQQRGLMFRDDLGATDGMLFLFDRADRHAFWMRGVRIPLDIIWIGPDGAIVAIAGDAPPCGGPSCEIYEPPSPAVRVVEVRGGFARAHGLAVGSPVTIDLDEVGG